MNQVFIDLDCLDGSSGRGLGKLWWKRIRAVVSKQDDWLTEPGEEPALFDLQDKLQKTRPSRLTPQEWSILKRNLAHLLSAIHEQEKLHGRILE